jgi:hypothetical protein
MVQNDGGGGGAGGGGGGDDNADDVDDKTEQPDLHHRERDGTAVARTTASSQLVKNDQRSDLE